MAKHGQDDSSGSPTPSKKQAISTEFSLLDVPQLVDWLTLREIVCLLSTCKSLRRDDDMTSRVLRQNSITSKFYQNVLGDWCGSPVLLHGCKPPTTAASSTWDSKALASEEKSRLLSLVGLMESQLLPLCYNQREAGRGRITAVPFLAPLGLSPDSTTDDTVLDALEDHDLNWIGDDYQEPDDDSVGIHWDNLETNVPDTRACELCFTLKDYYGDPERWINCGNSCMRDEFLNHMNSVKVRNPRDPMSCEKWVYLLSHESNDSFQNHVCDRLIRPLRKFFDRNNFQFLRRVEVPDDAYDSGRMNVKAVECIAGLSPTGCFAGVYLIKNGRYRYSYEDD